MAVVGREPGDGEATSTHVGPGQKVAQGSQQTATGDAQEQVAWYFPQHGQTTADNGGTPVGACTGP